ncbi:MAG: calcium/sodium antiporter [Chloroflexota bacterium]
MDTQILDILLVLGGLAGLYFGGNWLVTGSSRLALRFNVPPIIVGLTIVAVGTSAPELFVSVGATLRGNPGISLGNVIGSNIANIGLILGFTGAIRALTVREILVKREIFILLTITLFTTLLTLDGQLSRLDGILLMSGFALFNFIFYTIAQSTTEPVDIELPDEALTEDGEKQKTPAFMDIVYIWGGITLLVIGGQWMVEGATNIARNLGVSELVIGVTLVAFGTSLPELATSATAVLKGETDIAVGNVIGSNIANLLLVLGATSFIAPIAVGATELSVVEFVVMIGFTVLLIPFARNRVLSRTESALFLGGYFAFIIYSFI